MLRICISSDRKLNSEYIFTELRKNTKKGQILLVPEQFSHMAERDICTKLGPQANRFVEVLSFSRLAARVFSIYGGGAEIQTDAVGRLMMMSLAVEQVRSRLKLYANAADKPQFLLKLIDIFQELQSECITAQMLKEASSEIGGALAVKVEEIALLMESFESVCANLGQNPSSRLTRLAEVLEDCDYAEDKCFYIDAFSDFNSVELEILASLLNQGAQITAAFHCDSLHKGSPQFEAARRAANKLQQIATKQGVEVKLDRLETGSNDARSYMQQHLFTGAKAPYDGDDDSIVFIRGGDAAHECACAAGEILRLVENGVRYRDIAVACGDAQQYISVLKTVFRRAQIPAYYAGDVDILRQSVVHMLLSALEAATVGFEAQTVLQYLKSGFLSITPERCDQMENYIFTWNIHSGEFTKEWTRNPFGLGKVHADPAIVLQQLNEDRVKYIQPLIRLRDRLRTAANTAQMLEAVSAFMDEIRLNEQLNLAAQRLYEENDLQKAQEYAQVYSIICRLLEQMYGVLGTSVRSPENFYHMLLTALSQCSIGTIPASLDCVNVGSLSAQRRLNAEYIFILGANEGAFPSAQSNRSLLTEHERNDLLGAGVPIAPRVTAALDRELASIGGVLDTANKTLYFGGVSGLEAYYLKRAHELFPHARCIEEHTDLIQRSERDYLYHIRSNPSLDCQEDLVEKLSKIEQPYEIGSLKEETVKELYGNELHISSSQIDKMASCHFGYFLQYGLYTEEQKVAQMDASAFGTFVHDVLEHCASQVMLEGGFHKVTLERTLQICEDCMEAYTKEKLGELWQSERAEYLFRRSFGEVRKVIKRLYEELSACEFEPKWFELRFKQNKELPAIKIAGKKMTAYLEGAVDRVDLWHDGERMYVRIVDYKTGSMEFEWSKVFNGLGLQMLIYLFAIKQNGMKLCGQPLHCAGVLYFLANAKPVSLKGKYDKDESRLRENKGRRSGLVLHSDHVLQAMEPGDEHLTLPDKKFYTTTEQFDTLERFVYRKVEALTDSVAEGCVKPDPYYIAERTNACQYCPYKEICRGNKTERWIKTVKSADEFWPLAEEVES
ncbi:MAG: hypothetical protein E7467_05825 [Ruminococcaceae bacterium]|nr:hypothetical protein [Oscillospiraceae bacterium]